MKDFLSVICSSQLFSGVTETELTAVLACLDAKKTSFPKEAYLMHTGDTAEAIGFVLSGNVLTVQEDIWGNRHILSNAGPGQTFAAAFACAPGAVLNVSVVAQTPVTVMFLNVRRILSVCTSACSHHSRIIRNLLGELADKNLMLSEKFLIWGSGQQEQRLCPISPLKRKKAEPMNLIFLFPVSSSPTISLSSAADCPLNSVKCVMRDFWNSTRAILC